MKAQAAKRQSGAVLVVSMIMLVLVTLMIVTAVLAALYPMRIVARLPIAATLRDEVTS